MTLVARGSSSESLKLFSRIFGISSASLSLSLDFPPLSPALRFPFKFFEADAIVALI